MIEKDVKSCFSVNKLISTKEGCGEHPFAGKNTQHVRDQCFQKEENVQKMIF